jgi:hypothetical protein
VRGNVSFKSFAGGKLAAEISVTVEASSGENTEWVANEIQSLLTMLEEQAHFSMIRQRQLLASQEAAL